MSLQFSDTTNKNGIIQHLERTLGFNDGDISGNTTRLAQFTSDVNLALDNVHAIIFKAGGTWDFDDTNHTDYPIITANTVSGQRDYSFTTDSSSNIILDIHKVMIKTSADGEYKTIKPVDMQSVDQDTDTYASDATGSPVTYDKTANGIFLDPIPDTSVTAGLRVYISREGSYFATSDTTKKAGFNGLFHKYLVLHAAYNYAVIKDISTAKAIGDQMILMEREIADSYGRRSRDEKPRLTANVERTR